MTETLVAPTAPTLTTATGRDGSAFLEWSAQRAGLDTPPPKRDTIRSYAVGGDIDVDVAGRRISGCVMPYGVPSRPRAFGGQDMFLEGAMKVYESLPTPLYAGHNEDQNPIGVSTDWEQRPDGLYMSFSIFNTPRGNETLVCIDGGLRGLSASANDVTERYDDVKQIAEISSARLVNVAYVGAPAFGEHTQIHRVWDMSGGVERPAPRPAPARQSRAAEYRAKARQAKLDRLRRG